MDYLVITAEDENIDLKNAVFLQEQKDHFVVSSKPVYSFVKRLFDVFVSVVALTILLVPMLLLALIIVIDSPGASPIFVQDRVGKNGKKFKFFKFRSMYPDADKRLEELLKYNEMEGPAFKIKHDPRISRVGKFIRKSSIDELPQLINVLIGNMSIVGPRPPLPREVEQYNEEYFRRLYITPGITCLWQVQNHRNDLTFEQWYELDIKYINERSLLTDLAIIFRTIATVFKMDGV